MGALSLDTTFLVDLEREIRRGPDIAHHFLSAHAKASFHCSVVAYGEYMEGAKNRFSELDLYFKAAFTMRDITSDVALIYADLSHGLRKEGNLIGPNDLWIAATAIQLECPLVTRNIKHFERVPGLNLLSY